MHATSLHKAVCEPCAAMTCAWASPSAHLSLSHVDEPPALPHRCLLHRWDGTPYRLAAAGGIRVL